MYMFCFGNFEIVEKRNKCKSNNKNHRLELSKNVIYTLYSSYKFLFCVYISIMVRWRNYLLNPISFSIITETPRWSFFCTSKRKPCLVGWHVLLYIYIIDLGFAWINNNIPSVCCCLLQRRVCLRRAYTFVCLPNICELSLTEKTNKHMHCIIIIWATL